MSLSLHTTDHRRAEGGPQQSAFPRKHFQPVGFKSSAWISFTAFLYCESIRPSRLMLNQGSESCFCCCLNIPIPKFDWFGELLVERVSGQMVMRGISSRPVNHRHPCTTLIQAVRSLHTPQICFFPLQENKHKNTYCSPYQPPQTHFSHGCSFLSSFTSRLLW